MKDAAGRVRTNGSTMDGAAPSGPPPFKVAKSRVVLIGASEFERDKSIKALRAVRHNLRDLEQLFADPQRIGIDDIERIENRSYPDLVDRLRTTCRGGRPCLIVYYVGHGLVSDNTPPLRLASANTTFDDLDDNSFPYRSLLRVVNEVSGASVKIIILDCCYSGRAADEGMIRSGLGRSCLLAASGGNEQAFSPIGKRHTGLTGHLIAAINEGIDNGKKILSVKDVFEEVSRRCTADTPRLPEPITVYYGDSDLIKLCHNAKKPKPKKAMDDLSDSLRQLTKKFPALERVPQLVDKIKKREAKEAQKRKQLNAGEELEKYVHEIVQRHRNRAMEFDDVKLILRNPTFRQYYLDRPYPMELLSEKNSIEIKNNGDTRITCTSVAKVMAGPLCSVFWTAFGDTRLKSNDDVNLRVKFPSQIRTVIAPIRKSPADPNLREWVIFLDPPVRADKTFTSTASWSWPGVFKALSRGEPDFWVYWAQTAGTSIPKVSFEFSTPENWGKLAIRNTGPGKNGTPKRTSISKGKMKTIREMNDVRKGTQLVLDIRNTPRKLK